MNTSSPTDGSSPVRLLARIIVDTVSGGSNAWSSAFKGDLYEACVWLALDLANLEPIFSNDKVLQRFLKGEFNDEDRRPISVRGLGGSLGFDDETTRRHVKRLVSEGLCEHRADGMIVTSAVYDRPEIQRASITSLRMLVKLIQGLEKWGALPRKPDRLAVVGDIDEFGRGTATRAQRLCIMLFSEYVFKFSIEHIRIFDNNIITMTVFLDVLRENNIPFLEDDDLAIQYSRIDTLIPDTLRLPTSARAISRRLGFPPETVRRHVKKLMELRLVEPRVGGLVVPTSVMERPEFVRVITDMTSWVASLIKKVNRVSGGVS